MKNIAIFASGRGSNAEQILKYIQTKELSEQINVGLIVSNKKEAPVLDLAKRHGITSHILKRKAFYERTELLDVLEQHKIDWIILAGFLWLIPGYLVERFDHKIVNIHPALLPKYGGKGMYGMHVHKAVKAAGETQSGISIHYVNEHYDEGNIIFQTTCELDAQDTAEMIASKVLALEHQHFPQVVARLVLGES
ncbi:MAG: phosphoribosylglycinamide formyltransferase [Bacteroidota bacterium]